MVRQKIGIFLFHLLLLLPLLTAWVEPHTSGSCPLEGRRNVTFRNYCEMYTKCVDGQSVLETCPDGLHFHQFKRICDFPKNVKGCDLMDAFAPVTAPPGPKTIAKIQQNFECDPLNVIVKRTGKRRCRVQIICANGISFVLKRCMQTISLRL